VKVGDLVLWTHPDAEGVGIIVSHTRGEPLAHIYWFDEPEKSGFYDVEHHYLELISESR